MKYAELLEKYERLLSENETLKAAIMELEAKITEESKVKCMVKKTENIINDKATTGITKKSSTQEKLELFLSIFRGRTDVCAKRWRNKPGYSPYCFNDFKPGICNKPRTKCMECKQSNFAPLDRKQLEKHLLGDEVIGLYPLTIKDTCCLLAIDFDKSTWRDDTAVIRGVCRKHDIPMYVERSRSGNGAHLWFFFDSEIKAVIARKFGMCILEQAMQSCGSIGFDSFDRFIVPRFTTTRMPVYKEEKAWHITQIYQHVCECNNMNKLIVSDIEEAIEKGGNPLVLTERTSHIKQLVELLSGKGINVIELSGNLTTKNRKKAVESIRAIKSGERYVIIATGKLIGEGFDEARLDTLFMAMPIAWKGMIAQYAGRLHRNYAGKKEVLIYDYVDVHIPVLERMYHKRLTAYRALGYSIKTSSSTSDLESGIFDESNYLDYVLKDIESAKKHVLISSPYLQKKKIENVKDLLLKTYSSGIRVTLCTNEIVDFPDKQMNYIKETIEEISGKGIDIIQIKNNRYRFMIIDSRIVWYGGIDILGRSLNEQSLIRIDNEALANELTGIIYEHISQ